jgi:hypothetical protein
VCPIPKGRPGHATPDMDLTEENGPACRQFASRNEVKAECAKHSYHIVQHGDQWLVFCDKGSVKIIA